MRAMGTTGTTMGTIRAMGTTTTRATTTTTTTTTTGALGRLRRVRRDRASRATTVGTGERARDGTRRRIRVRSRASFGEAYATWGDEDAFEDDATSRRRARRERFKGFEGFEGFENEDEDEDEEASRGRGRGRGRRRRVDARRERRGSGDGFEASANIVKLAYKALTGVSEAFTRALDVVLPRWVPMYVIRLVVACGWGAFALASATRLIYGVVVVGAVLCLFVALGNDAGDGGRERAAGIYEYATDSSARGRRRREDFDERRRAAARARKSARARGIDGGAYGDYGDDERVAYDGDDADDAFDDARAPTFDFDARAFERGAEAFNETFGNSSEGAREAFRAARDVTVEVRQFGDEALREFKRAFSVNGGDFDFDGDDGEGDDGDDGVVAVEFPSSSRDEDGGSAVVQIIDVDALSTRDSVDEDAMSRNVDVSFDEWIGTPSSSAATRAEPGSSSRDAAPPSRDASRRDDVREFDEREGPDADEFANAFRDAFSNDAFSNGASSRTRTGASRNWLDEFISGKFRGAFQEDLIDVDFVADDDEEGVDGVKEERSSDSPR